jgi:probable F420-dependent oxidoreductase
MPDHYVPMLSPLVALQCAADATTRLRLGTYVIANDYRHPAELAKQFATLDVLSDGRAEVGIGTGYNQPEYEALGLQYDPAGRRVDRLDESLQILRGLLDGEKVTFQGEHYRLTDYESHPRPVQQRVPIMVGAGGRRLLSIAARRADIVGLAPSAAGFADVFASCTWAATEQKVAWIRQAAPDRFESLEINSYSPLAPAQITDNPRAAVRDYLDQVRKVRSEVTVTEDDLLESPHIFIGTLDSIVEKLHRMREELGISYLMFHEVDPLAPVVKRLAGT